MRSLTQRIAENLQVACISIVKMMMFQLKLDKKNNGRGSRNHDARNRIKHS